MIEAEGHYSKIGRLFGIRMEVIPGFFAFDKEERKRMQFLMWCERQKL